MKRKNPIPIGGSATKKKSGIKMALIAGFAIAMIMMVSTAQANTGNSLDSQESSALTAQNQIMQPTVKDGTSLVALNTDAENAVMSSEVTVTKIPTVAVFTAVLSADETLPLLAGNQASDGNFQPMSIIVVTSNDLNPTEGVSGGGQLACCNVNLNTVAIRT